MSIYADTCQHADKVEMVGIRGDESDATCWHISAHISACRHISAHVGMSTCADTYQHGGKVQMDGIRDDEIDATCRRTCRHISAHVGMSKCADTCQHADEVQMVCIKDAESDGTCWHVSTHISTCRHISAHVGMSKCADTCQHAGKIQMVCIRGAESDAICWHISAHVGPYQHMSAHVGTYQHMSACPHVLAYVIMQIQIIGIIGTENDVTFRHMSAHVSTCRHVTRCRHMPTCAGTYVPTSWLWHSLRHPARCPRLTLEHRRRRREWGKRHRVGYLRQWRHCIFSDESRFSLYHSDGQVRVRAVGKGRDWLMPASSLMMEIVARHGMGCNPPWGRSELVVVDGAMNRHRYIQILRNQMLPWATGVFGCNFVYVQDNTPPHTARDMAAFLDQQDVEFMDWPARSPDMNPIEHVWDQMSVWIRDMDDTPPPFHHSWTKQCCLPGVGCISDRKGADPGREHASSCQGSSGR